MYKLKKTGLRVLKICHLLAVCCWTGGAVSMIILNLHNYSAVSEGMLYGINTASHLIDIWVVVTFGAMGCLITGLLYGMLTNWGFFKYRWIISKWLLVIVAFVSATLTLGPGEAAMLELSRDLGANALHSDAYLAEKTRHLYWSIVQIVIYTLLIILSVIKPWGKRKAAETISAAIDAPSN